MAQGDVTFLDQAVVYFFKGSPDCPFDLGSTPDTIKVALIKSAANGGIDPAVDDADPCWGSGGTTDYSAAEVTPGGNYSAGGAACASPSVSLVSGHMAMDMDDPATWAQNASNPTNARWGIIYSDTATNKNAIAFVDLGSDFDMTTGPLSIAWGAPFTTADQA